MKKLFLSLRQANVLAKKKVSKKKNTSPVSD